MKVTFENQSTADLTKTWQTLRLQHMNWHNTLQDQQVLGGHIFQIQFTPIHTCIYHQVKTILRFWQLSALQQISDKLCIQQFSSAMSIYHKYSCINIINIIKTVTQSKRVGQSGSKQTHRWTTPVEKKLWYNVMLICDYKQMSKSKRPVR